MNATQTTTAALAAKVRVQALSKLGRLYKCTPDKAAERMARPKAQYEAYRVAFANFVEEALANVFAHIGAGMLAIKPAHWSAAPNPDAYVGNMPGIPGRLHGVRVSYWMPGVAA